MTWNRIVRFLESLGSECVRKSTNHPPYIHHQHQQPDAVRQPEDLLGIATSGVRERLFGTFKRQQMKCTGAGILVLLLEMRSTGNANEVRMQNIEKYIYC